MKLQKNENVQSSMSTTSSTEIVNVFEDLFAKKAESVEHDNSLNNNEHKDIYQEQSEIKDEKNLVEDIKTEEVPLKDEKKDKVIWRHEHDRRTMYETITQDKYVIKLTEKVKKFGFKNIVSCALTGLLLNVVVYHHNSVSTQHISQKFVSGLMYNLSETNDLNRIAKNIYLGMQDEGWKPTVNISNNEIFSFTLKNGGEFSIVKDYRNLGNVSFHVEVKNFSSAMLDNLQIALSPGNFAGTNNFIVNKTYNAGTNTITFDVEKISDFLPPMLPSINDLPPTYLPTLPMPNQVPNYNSSVPNLDPQIIQIPITSELDKEITRNLKNQNLIDNGIYANQIQKTPINKLPPLPPSNLGKNSSYEPTSKNLTDANSIDSNINTDLKYTD